jgi:plastocyanin
VFGSLVRRLTRIALIATLAVLLPAAAAHAATKVVFAGYDAPPGAPFGTEPEGFYPDTVSIHPGDRVQWRFRGFHDVELLAHGQKRPPFVISDPAAPIASQNDAAGQPFWWSGQPALAENPAIVGRLGGSTHSGKGGFNSGLAAATYTLRFQRAGTFHYKDPVHPGVQGTVRVVSKRRRVPARRADDVLAAAQITHATDTGRALVHAAPPPAGVVEVGREAKGVAVNLFFPSQIAIDAGQSLTFAVPRRGVELHTVALGPEAHSLQGKAVVAGSFDPLAAFPSDRPPGLPDYTGSNHGDGFLNTGLLDGDPATPFPDSATIRFAAAGTYTIGDVLHPGMEATVEVGGG